MPPDVNLRIGMCKTVEVHHQGVVSEERHNELPTISKMDRVMFFDIHIFIKNVTHSSHIHNRKTAEGQD